MRIRRAMLPAIIVLSLAGSALTGAAAATAATRAPMMHFHGRATVAPMMHFHGRATVAPMMHFHGRVTVAPMMHFHG